MLIDTHFFVLRLERRYAELRALVDGVAEPYVRAVAGLGATVFFGVGQRPAAQYRGWAALLQGDRASAATHGQAVLDFVGTQRETTQNSWFLRLLQAPRTPSSGSATAHVPPRGRRST